MKHFTEISLYVVLHVKINLIAMKIFYWKWHHMLISHVNIFGHEKRKPKMLHIYLLVPFIYTSWP
jgi:hypothetical protein